ncbi:MAG TPA: peptide chain release factor 2 [Spirochaetota bacterium]|nr:peptide chain release factor 2 [Spirochaetota bacterium]HOM09898.1 peptide chain release factor 2 [Spirochaetota bacterium]HPP48757.1 peptide chain release factor 2 [Spirochaetota bacterium]
MLEYTDVKDLMRELTQIKASIEELYTALHIDDKKKQLQLLVEETYKENFWQDQARSTLVQQQITQLKKNIEPWDILRKDIEDSIMLLEMAIDENDTDVIGDIASRVEQFTKRFEQLETLELLSDPDDDKNAIMTIHPGAGGTESQDWASMLMRMYTRWAEDNGFDVEILDYMPDIEAGIKEVVMLIKGEYAYGLLKGERGIHRLVRISPFDSNQRRHTSFASVDVIPEAPEDIDIEINESDLRIDTYRASGAGGQHVNRTDSAVRITHIPTGIVVQCQNERSQHKNKAYAMKILKSRLYELRKRELEKEKLEKFGEKKDIAWGNQIRSYVFHPYTMVKDHRTGEETGSVDHVMDGDINRFIYAYLKSLKSIKIK